MAGNATRSGPGTVRWALAAVCVVLGLLGGYLLHAAQERTWTATTTVLVLPTAGGRDAATAAGRGATEVQIETEAEVARSAQVAQAAAPVVDGGADLADVLAATAVTVPSNTSVLEISFSADSPETARSGAAAVAEAYLSRRSEAAAQSKAEVVEGLQTSLVELDAELRRNASAIAAADAPSEASELALAEAQRDVLVGQLADVNRRLAALQFETTTGGEVLSAAQEPTEPSSAGLPLHLAGGLAVGLLAGAGVLLSGGRRTGEGQGSPSSPAAPAATAPATSAPAAGGRPAATTPPRDAASGSEVRPARSHAALRSPSHQRETTTRLDPAGTGRDAH